MREQIEGESHLYRYRIAYANHGVVQNKICDMILLAVRECIPLGPKLESTFPPLNSEMKNERLLQGTCMYQATHVAKC